MSKFLNLIEEFDPENTGDPKWKLIDFLKSKGINVSVIRNTDMLYIDTGESTISVTVSPNEEEAEGINAGTGTYDIDREVQDLAAKAAGGLKGMVAKRVLGTDPQMAKQAVQERGRMSGQAVNAYKKGTERIRKGLQAVGRQPINSSY